MDELSRFGAEITEGPNEIIDSETGDVYERTVANVAGHIIEIHKDSGDKVDSYHIRADRGKSKANTDQGGIAGFIMDLLGLR